MNKHVFISIVLVAVMAAACHKEPEPVVVNYGVDGRTPLPEAVDMGITVDGYKVLWASFNLGASTEYEYGDYYAWGETQTKETYSWGNYKFSDGSGDERITKYFPKNDPWWEEREWALDTPPDGITSLLPEDDVARLKLGGGWRMPSLKEIEALLATSKDPRYSGWGKAVNAPGSKKDAAGMLIKGYRITYNVNGNSIFLPLADAAGPSGVMLGTTTWDGYHMGEYWSSELYEHGGGAVCLFLHDHKNPYMSDADRYGTTVSGGTQRCYGLSIRPVKPVNQ